MKKINFKLIFNILIPLILLLVFENSFLMFSKTMVLSLLLIYTIYIFLAVLFKNTKWATLILSIVEVIILFVSKMKLAISYEPMFFTDVIYVQDAGEINSIVDGIFMDTLFKLMPFFVISLIIIVSTNIFSFKYNYKFENQNKRMMIACFSYIILLIMFLPIESINKYVLNTFFDANAKTNEIGIKNGVEACDRYGHLAAIYGDLLDSRLYRYKPDIYDEKKIEKTLSSAEKLDDTSLGKPNIIVIFSESFWDIDQVKEIEFDKEITPNFNRLKEEGLFFNMISPSFGGNSANVEFEFLTGGSLAYFSRSYVAYMGLYNNKKYNNSPSILRDLDKAGYYIKLLPFSTPALFRCGEVYKYFPIDEVEFLPKVSKKHTKGIYPSDEYAMDKAIEALENKEEGRPLFYMTMTMEAHMPFVDDKFDKYDIKVTKSDLDPKTTNQAKVYAQGVYDADRQLARLYEYVKTFDEPTIIVFYGDHLPFIEAIDKWKFFNTKDEKLNYYRRYNTQSLILANFDISNLKEENKTELQYLGPDLLSSYILNHMDIEISDYYKWLYSTRNTTAAFNRFVSVDQKGNISYTKNLNKDMQDLYDLRKMIQYKYFVDLNLKK
ncbi:MAG: LTA synthase family protein [Bacilli bacterium]|nr:LTA synthase family protein [Bacilli bacterium]